MHHLLLHFLVGIGTEANHKSTGKEAVRDGFAHQIDFINGIVPDMGKDLLQHPLRQLLSAEMVFFGQLADFAVLIFLALHQFQCLLPVDIQLLLHSGKGAVGANQLQRTVNGIVIHLDGGIQILQAACIVPAQPPAATDEVGIGSGRGLKRLNGTVAQSDGLAAAPQHVQRINDIGVFLRHHRGTGRLPLLHLLLGFQVLGAMILLKIYLGKFCNMGIHILQHLFLLLEIFPICREGKHRKFLQAQGLDSAPNGGMAGTPRFHFLLG